MRRKGQLGFFMDAWRDYGDLAHLKLGPQEIFLVIHPDHVRHVNVSYGDNYDKLETYDVVRELLLAMGGPRRAVALLLRLMATIHPACRGAASARFRGRHRGRHRPLAQLGQAGDARGAGRRDDAAHRHPAFWPDPERFDPGALDAAGRGRPSSLRVSPLRRGQAHLLGQHASGAGAPRHRRHAGLPRCPAAASSQATDPQVVHGRHARSITACPMAHSPWPWRETASVALSCTIGSLARHVVGYTRSGWVTIRHAGWSRSGTVFPSLRVVYCRPMQRKASIE